MFNHLILLLKKAILYKRNHLKEDNELEKRKEKSLSKTDKKKQLKLIYKRILTGTPYEENLSLFMQLIDQVPEDYLNYELGINLGSAMKMVDELIRGKGDFTPDELKNIVNITKGIGFPAIEHHAAGGKLMPKEQQVFGAHHMNKNVDELMGSLEKRRNPKNKLPAPQPENKRIGTTAVDTIHREVVPTEEVRNRLNSRLAKILGMPQVKDTEFWRIASKMKGAGMNTERMASSIANIISSAQGYEEAKEKAKETLHLDFTKGDDLFRTMWNEKKRQGVKANESVRNFIRGNEKFIEEEEDELDKWQGTRWAEKDSIRNKSSGIPKEGEIVTIKNKKYKINKWHPPWMDVMEIDKKGREKPETDDMIHYKRTKEYGD